MFARFTCYNQVVFPVLVTLGKIILHRTNPHSDKDISVPFYIAFFFRNQLLHFFITGNAPTKHESINLQRLGLFSNSDL